MPVKLVDFSTNSKPNPVKPGAILLNAHTGGHTKICRLHPEHQNCPRYQRMPSRKLVVGPGRGYRLDIDDEVSQSVKCSAISKVSTTGFERNTITSCTIIQCQINQNCMLTPRARLGPYYGLISMVDCCGKEDPKQTFKLMSTRVLQVITFSVTFLWTSQLFLVKFVFACT